MKINYLLIYDIQGIKLTIQLLTVNIKKNMSLKF